MVPSRCHGIDAWRRLASVVNALDHNAISDGTTDDRAALLAAANEAVASGLELFLDVFAAFLYNGTGLAVRSATGAPNMNFGLTDKVQPVHHKHPCLDHHHHGGTTPLWSAVV
jgi:hypothetical protein